MKHLSHQQRLALEDLLVDLWHARNSGALGRLALVSYYEVRRWARMAGELGLVEHSAALVTGCPHPDRERFLDQVDKLIVEMEQLLNDDGDPISGVAAPLHQQAHDAARTAH
jgi:hypothetical protein